jgi:hypothetical protein
MQAEHIYLIEGAGTANSPFFENEAHCHAFLKLADKHLGAFLSINSFQNNRDGWVMIITTKSAETIREAYRLRRAKSKKCKVSCAHHEVWRMLSDQIRIMLSTFVKSTNAKSGRTGGKVRGNYKRYVFENVDEVEQMKETLSKQNHDQSQTLKRYSPSKKLFNVKNKQMKRSIYMCCARLTTASRVRKLGLRCLHLAGLIRNVLRHLVQATFDHHFPPDLLLV